MQQKVDNGELTTLSELCSRFAEFLKGDPTNIRNFLRAVMYAGDLKPCVRVASHETARGLYDDATAARLFLAATLHQALGFTAKQAAEAVRLTANYDRDATPGVKRPVDALEHAISEIKAGKPFYFVMKHVVPDFAPISGAVVGYLSPVPNPVDRSFVPVTSVVTLPIHVLLAPCFGIDAEKAALSGMGAVNAAAA